MVDGEAGCARRGGAVGRRPSSTPCPQPHRPSDPGGSWLPPGSPESIPDYTRRTGILATGHAAPPGTDPSWRDPLTWAHRIEAVDKRKNSRQCRDDIVGIPRRARRRRHGSTSGSLRAAHHPPGDRQRRQGGSVGGGSGVSPTVSSGRSSWFWNSSGNLAAESTIPGVDGEATARWRRDRDLAVPGVHPHESWPPGPRSPAGCAAFGVREADRPRRSVHRGGRAARPCPRLHGG